MITEKKHIKVKVCGLTMKENIKKVAALEIDMIGLNFAAVSPRFLRDKKSIIDLLHEIKNVLKIGIFVDPSAQYVSEMIDKYQLDKIQLHGQESADFCNIFSGRVKVIKAFGIDEYFDYKLLEKYKTSCDYLLFDTFTSLHGGSGKTFNWKLLEGKNIPLPFLLSGGIDSDMIDQIKLIDLPNFTGVDINSKFEIKPGIKNVEKIKAFINELRS